MLPTLRTFEYNYSTHQRIQKSKYKNKYLTLYKYWIFVQKVLLADAPIQLQQKDQGESGLFRDSTIWSATVEVSTKY